MIDFIMIKIVDDIFIDESLINEEFIRSSGPGGQNVNKVSTAVQLRFNIRDWKKVNDAVKERLIKIAGKKVVKEKESGIPLYIIIKANRFRTQEKNREDAVNRIKEMVKRALIQPKNRIKTKPSKSSVERRIKEKKIHKKTKESRKKINLSDLDS